MLKSSIDLCQMIKTDKSNSNSRYTIYHNSISTIIIIVVIVDILLTKKSIVSLDHFIRISHIFNRRPHCHYPSVLSFLQRSLLFFLLKSKIR